MKNFVGQSIAMFLLIGSINVQAGGKQAGIKEAGGDESLLFVCRSLPTADSNVVIFGIKHELDNGVDLVTYVNDVGQVLDQGVLGSGVNKFMGSNYEITFTTQKDGRAKLKALVDTNLLNKGDIEKLTCNK